MSNISPSDPSAIIEQIQIPTDIEGDLADTALAVASTEPSPSVDVANQDDSIGSVMQNAEAMESVLEQSIPSAPDEAPQDNNKELALPISDNEQETTAEPSAVVHDASTVSTAIDADLNALEQPEAVIPPLHDISIEPAVEESSGKAMIAVEQPDVEHTAQVITNGVVLPEAKPPVSTTPPEVPPASTQIVEAPISIPQQTTPPKLPAQTPYASLQSPNGEVKLPEGLSESSPSVLALPDLVRSWKSGRRSDLRISLRLALTPLQILRMRM